MRKLFMPYILALQLKEKGFNEQCFGTYKPTLGGINKIIDFHTNELHPINSDYVNGWISAIQWQQAIDWFYDIHNIKIDYTRGNDGKFAPKLINFETNREHNYDYSINHIRSTRYEAIELAIVLALEVI